MRFDIQTRATAACSLGVLALSALASHFLLRLFFGFLRGAAETGLEKDIISPGALLVICLLIGLMMAVVCFRPILGWIRENGLPGWIAAPDPFEDKSIRVALMVSETGGTFPEVYNQWIPAHHLVTLMKGPLGKQLTLGNREGDRLSILRSTAPQDEGGGEVLVVKFKKCRKMMYNMEMPAQARGEFDSSAEEDYASCFYPLTFVGCDMGADARGWLKFGGEKRIMRMLFLD